jgi:hypothetical protein
MREYRTIDTTTLQGLRTAERLHTSSKWKQGLVTPFSTQFYRNIYPGWRNMTQAQRRNEHYETIWENKKP